MTTRQLELMHFILVETTVTSINVSAFPVEHRTLDELLNSRDKFDHKQYLGSARVMSLCLDFSPSKQKKGGFKLATFGTTNQPIFGAGLHICAKQTFYRKTARIKSPTSSGEDVKITQNIPHDRITQVRNLTMEIACIVWARVLLNLVYKFVDHGIELHGSPPFTILRMRFVEAALAIEQVEKGGEARAFLLEEVIGSGDEGRFRKYMNNVSATPTHFANEDDEERAKFLAFTQHVQYFKTKKMAFVADYQGEFTRARYQFLHF
jgi:hypothetical protein